MRNRLFRILLLLSSSELGLARMNFEVNTFISEKRHERVVLVGRGYGTLGLFCVLVIALLGLLPGCNTLAGLNERDGSGDAIIDVDALEPCTETSCLGGKCSDAGVCECDADLFDLDGRMGCEFSFASVGCVKIQVDVPVQAPKPGLVLVMGSDIVAIVGDFGGAVRQTLCIFPLDKNESIDCAALDALGTVGDVSITVFKDSTEPVFGLGTDFGVHFAKYRDSKITLEGLLPTAEFRAPVVGLPHKTEKNALGEFVALDDSGKLVWLAIGDNTVCTGGSPCVIAPRKGLGGLETMAVTEDEIGSTVIGVITDDGEDKAGIVSASSKASGFAVLANSAIGSGIYTDSVLYKDANNTLVFAYVAGNDIGARRVTGEAFSEPLFNETLGEIFEIEMLGSVLMIASGNGLFGVDLDALDASNPVVKIASYKQIGSAHVLGMSSDGLNLLLLQGDGNLCHFVAQ